MTAVLFTSLDDNRCPIPELRVQHRADPYWDDLWRGTNTSWHETKLAERRVESGVAQRMRRIDAAYQPAQARRAFMDLGRSNRQLRSEALRALGLISSWRTISLELLRTFSAGEVRERSSWHAAGRGGLGAGVVSGLFERGELHLPELGADIPNLYRPGTSTHRDWSVSSCSMAEWFEVTGGCHLTRGTQGADKHNMLAVEGSARAAELCPEVVGVAGEGLASVDNLFPDKPVDARMKRVSPDAVWLRSDGLRICVEVTSNGSTQSFREKVVRWVERLMVTDSLDAGATVVLFVDISAASSNTRYQLEQHVISSALRDSAWAHGRQVPARMATVRWRHWFPAPGMVDEGFRSLVVERPTGPPDNDGEITWEPVRLLDLDEVPFHPADPDDWQWATKLLGQLHQSPSWLRDSQPRIDWDRWVAQQIKPANLRARVGLTPLPKAMPAPVPPSPVVVVEEVEDPWA